MNRNRGDSTAYNGEEERSCVGVPFQSNRLDCVDFEGKIVVANRTAGCCDVDLQAHWIHERDLKLLIWLNQYVTRYVDRDNPFTLASGEADRTTSALGLLDFRVDGFEFRSGVVDFHLPFDAALRGVGVFSPGCGFGPQFFFASDSAAGHALAG